VVVAAQERTGVPGGRAVTDRDQDGPEHSVLARAVDIRKRRPPACPSDTIDDMNTDLLTLSRAAITAADSAAAASAGADSAAADDPAGRRRIA
jgi:hypothetical protein